jgi:hypothetical protein
MDMMASEEGLPFNEPSAAHSYSLAQRLAQRRMGDEDGPAFRPRGQSRPAGPRRTASRSAAIGDRRSRGRRWRRQRRPPEKNRHVPKGTTRVGMTVGLTF